MGRARSIRDVIGEEPPDGWYPDDIPDPPVEEFDRDAIQALAILGVTEDLRERIKREARELSRAGQSRENVTNWICRQVAASVGGMHGFVGIDEDGNELEPDWVVEARAFIGRKAGGKRQARRNAVVDQWVARCRELMKKFGLNQRQVISLADKANTILTKRARGERTITMLDSRFADLQPLPGRRRLSTPTKERFRKIISAGLRRKLPA